MYHVCKPSYVYHVCKPSYVYRVCKPSYVYHICKPSYVYRVCKPSYVYLYVSLPMCTVYVSPSYVYQVFAEGKNSFVVRLIDGGQLVKFTSPDAEVLVKSLNAAVSAWQNQQPVSGGRGRGGGIRKEW